MNALGRVLLHLQCCGRLLQRKFGLSVCTRPLGGAVLRWWRDLTSWSSSWRLVGDGVGRRFTTGSEMEQKENWSFSLFFSLIWFFLKLKFMWSTKTAYSYNTKTLPCSLIPKFLKSTVRAEVEKQAAVIVLMSFSLHFICNFSKSAPNSSSFQNTYKIYHFFF